MKLSLIVYTTKVWFQKGGLSKLRNPKIMVSFSVIKFIDNPEV